MQAEELEAVWVRPKRAIQIVDIGMTKLYEWIATERVLTKKVDGMRLVNVPSLKKLGEAA